MSSSSILYRQHSPEEERSVQRDISSWAFAPRIYILQPLPPLQQPSEPALLSPRGPQFPLGSGKLMAGVPSRVEEGSWEGAPICSRLLFSQKSGENRTEDRGLPECTGISPTAG